MFITFFISFYFIILFPSNVFQFFSEKELSFLGKFFLSFKVTLHLRFNFFSLKMC